MKKILYLTAFAWLTIMTACNSGKTARTIGIEPANLDTTALPGNDFYQYACGGWMKANPLTPEYSRFGAFDKLRENNLEQLNGLISELAKNADKEKGVGRKIGMMFNIAMDSAKLNADGYQPLAARLDAIAAAGAADMQRLTAEMMRDLGGVYFHLYVAPDDHNSSMNILNTYQGGLGLGQREYYVETDPHTKEILSQYRKHIEKMFVLCGFEPSQASRAMKDVMEIETRIAKASFSMVELRDPQANYHKMTLDELKAAIPQVDWEQLFAVNGIASLESLNVSQVEPVREYGAIVASVPVEKQKNYLRWKLIDDAAGFLSDDIVNQNFAFYGKVLSGRQEIRPRWKRAVDAVDGVLSEAIGQMYVAKYFPAAAKERMVKLVDNLGTALGQRIDALEWMGDSTKAQAREKLAAMIVKVGYPDKWRDYSALEIKEDSYWQNVLRARKFESDYQLAKLGKPVDRTEWLMPPQMVNAYYNPSTNEICFPAAILQPPFFNAAADDAVNYGAIGVVIGHEMTHGFDDQGRQFDKDGNLRDWWTAQDTENFEARAKVLEEQFNNIEVLPGLKANGAFTLGENIADNGGLQVSFQAFRNATAGAPLAAVEGLTPEQRFYLAYAGVWAGNIRDEEIRHRTKSDPHSLGKWRVDGTLPNIDAWYEAFDVKEGDKMYVPADRRARIW